MTLEYRVQVLSDQLAEVRVRLCSLEANQRNAESATTGCSSRRDAALCTQNRTFQPAGNPLDWIEEFECKLEAELGSTESRYRRFGGAFEGERLKVLAHVLELFQTCRSQGAA